jgi:hypothetical protein
MSAEAGLDPTKNRFKGSVTKSVLGCSYAHTAFCKIATGLDLRKWRAADELCRSFEGTRALVPRRWVPSRPIVEAVDIAAKRQFGVLA